MIYFTAFKALIYSAVISLSITPLDFTLANAVGAIDVPRDGRRMHSVPIPRLGGLSMFCAFIATLLLLCCGDKTITELTPLLTGVVFIVIIGIIDDCKPLSAKIKLVAQAVITAFATSITINVNYDKIFFIFGTIWLMTLTNAHNFVDGLDGLCSGISLTEALALGTLFLIDGLSLWAICAFIVAGSCIGFLPYNGANAKIFMGDTGSTFLGFTLGVFSLKLILQSHSITGIISTCLIFAVPIFDIFFTIIRRLLSRQNVCSPDRSHVHHILADSKLGHRKASLLLRGISAIFAFAGVILYAS